MTPSTPIPAGPTPPRRIAPPLAPPPVPAAGSPTRPVWSITHGKRGRDPLTSSRRSSAAFPRLTRPIRTTLRCVGLSA